MFWKFNTFLCVGIFLFAIGIPSTKAQYRYYRTNQTQRLYDALNNNNTTEALDAIRRGAYVFADLPERQTFLMLAARKGNVDVFMDLAKKGFNLNYEDMYGRNALHHAVMGGNMAIVRYLYERGVDALATSSHCYPKCNCFQLAVQLDKMAIADYFLSKRKYYFLDEDTFKYISKNREKWYDFFIIKHNYFPTEEYYSIGYTNSKYLKIALQRDREYFKNNVAIQHLVATKGDYDLFKNLLSLNINIDSVHEGRSFLMSTIQGNNEKSLQLLLTANPNINYINNYRESAITTAIKTLNPKIVKMILEKKPDLPPDIIHIVANTSSKASDAPKILEIIKMLQAHGANLFYQDTDGDNALHISILSQNVGVVKYFLGTPLAKELEKNPQKIFSYLSLQVAKELHAQKISLKVKEGEENLYHYAVQSKNIELIDYALKNTIEDPTKRDALGNTPLIKLLKKFFFYYQQDQVDSKSSLYFKDECVTTEEDDENQCYYHRNMFFQGEARDGTEKKNAQKILDLFATEGSSVNIPDREGNYPLHYALLIGYYDLALKMVEKMNTETVNAVNKRRDTPLLLAAKHGQKALVQKLLEKKAMINFRDMSYKNAINHAAASGKDDIVLLLEKKYNVRLKVFQAIQENKIQDVIKIIQKEGSDYNEEGRTPLLEAIVLGRKDIVKKLIELNININLPDLNQKNVPWYLVKYNMTEFLPFVLARPEDILEKQEKDKNLLDTAIEQGNLELLKVFYQKLPQAFFVDNWDNNPIRKAILFRQPKVLDFLDEIGVNTRVYSGTINQMYELVKKIEHPDTVSKFENFEKRDNAIEMAINQKNPADILKAIENKNINQTLNKVDTVAHALVRTCLPEVLDVIKNTYDGKRRKNAENKTLVYLAVESCPYSFVSKLDEFLGYNAEEYENLFSALHSKTSVEVVDFVFSKNMDLSGKNQKNIPIVHELLNTCNRRVLENIPNIDLLQKRNAEGEYPIVGALQKCSLSFLKYYLEKTKKHTFYILLDNQENTFAHLCMKYKRPECIDILTTEMVSYVNKNLETVLWFALQYGDSETQKKILELQYANAKEKMGMIELCAATRKNAYQFVEKLKNLGVSLQLECNEKKQTPLMLSAVSKAHDVLRLLVAYGLNLDQEDSDGNTALHLAIQEKNEEAIRILLAAKAKRDKPNRKDETPEMLAKIHGISLDNFEENAQNGPEMEMVKKVRVQNVGEEESDENAKESNENEIKTAWLNKRLLQKTGWKANVYVTQLKENQYSGTIEYEALRCKAKLKFIRVFEIDKNENEKQKVFIFLQEIESGTCDNNCYFWIREDGKKYAEVCNQRITGTGDLSW